MHAWRSARPDDWKGFWENARSLFGFSAALLIWIQDPITPLVRLGARVIAARDAAAGGDDLVRR